MRALESALVDHGQASGRSASTASGTGPAQTRTSEQGSPGPRATVVDPTEKKEAGSGRGNPESGGEAVVARSRHLSSAQAKAGVRPVK